LPEVETAVVVVVESVQYDESVAAVSALKDKRVVPDGQWRAARLELASQVERQAIVLPEKGLIHGDKPAVPDDQWAFRITGWSQGSGKCRLLRDFAHWHWRQRSVGRALNQLHARALINNDLPGHAINRACLALDHCPTV
jgi:hypothetical protein